MQFTPQQIAGGAKFSSVTRIGNWSEEIALADAKLHNFQTKSAGGSLLLRKQQMKIAQCTQVVPHTFSEDGLVRFGDTIILQHTSTGRSLACDPYEDIFPGFRKFLVTGCADTSPIARNTFVVCRPQNGREAQSTYYEGEDQSVLRYGDPFILQCNESLLISPDGQSMAPPLYLASTQKNERTTTKVTNKQAAYMQETPSADCLWSVQKPSRGKTGCTERFVSHGLPVYSNEPFVLSHQCTNTFISTNAGTTELSDFGHEYEVFTSRESGKGKLAVMASEFSGKTTTGQLTKSTVEENEWVFMTAADPMAATDNRVLPVAPQVEELLDEIFQNLVGNNVGGFMELRKDFHDLDRVHDGRISLREVKKVFEKRGLSMANGRYDQVFNSVDKKGDRLIYYRELISLLRMPLSDSRMALMVNVYRDLDMGGNNQVPLATLSLQYQPQNHPLVQNATYGKEELRNVYLTNLIQSNQIRKQAPYVTLDSFVDYFSDLSSAIQDDEEFEAVFTSLWCKLS
mmetsp:Transcript_9303/g.17334  ORF Transcript_9303/g.17334 Transcript_9303/m.17334 type:complete len:514 (+) Transcript_9303:75-1616(+)|eukprot:CAMPEP_0114436738 /NCGR_PEP_ID=MMETSP0103-20121206/13621_1 /TAXON_ID=37642 ORGANISM="Paraphysomonas imperforata, Strain PA2" /NCGR_SAMPLE_ID=MMETSP0103 /ASSEMBLY_ACC=CAM_ASM_000201 /LENGTH=513 /DNA_ID=CAMNT_0001607045 /DNA_START=44 /DNA_END=1585 /DNA_ORIENTATION=+